MQAANVALPHNGTHVQRRKMFVSHPKHSLSSQFDLVWMQSLQSPLYSSRVRKQEFTKSIIHEYNSKVQERMRRQLNMDASTYKIIPGPPQKFVPYKNQKRSESMKNYYQFTPGKSRIMPNSRIEPYNFANDSLNQQVNHYNNSKTINNDSNLYSPTVSEKTRKYQQTLKNYLDDPIRTQNKDPFGKLPKKQDDKLEPYLRSDQKYLLNNPSLIKKF